MPLKLQQKAPLPRVFFACSGAIKIFESYCFRHCPGLISTFYNKHLCHDRRIDLCQKEQQVYSSVFHSSYPSTALDLLMQL